MIFFRAVATFPCDEALIPRGSSTLCTNTGLFFHRPPSESHLNGNHDAACRASFTKHPTGRPGRRCIGRDVVSHRMRTLKDHAANLRFDVEGEEDTNSNSQLYGFLMQFASDSDEGQAHNSDRMD